MAAKLVKEIMTKNVVSVQPGTSVAKVAKAMVDGNLTGVPVVRKGAVVGMVLLLIVYGVGHIGKGAQRWLDLGIIRFQPSELMKLAVPMTVAWFLPGRPLPPRSSVISPPRDINSWSALATNTLPRFSIGWMLLWTACRASCLRGAR